MKRKAQYAVWIFILLGLGFLFGMKFYAEYRPIKIYVSRTAQMPAELSSQLHMEEHQINPVIAIESLYQNAEDKILSMDEVRKIRSFLAWKFSPPILIEDLVIHSTNRVSTRRTTSKFLEEREIYKEDNQWVIKLNTRSDLENTRTNQ